MAGTVSVGGVSTLTGNVSVGGTIYGGGLLTIGTSADTALAGNTTILALGTTANTALAGSNGAAITANTAKKSAAAVTDINSAPAFVGQFAVVSSNGKIYIGTGTSGTGDWTELAKATS